MGKMIAACGLDCAACPAYIAAMTGNNALRAKTAEEWTKSFGFAFTPEMINCHGCLATDGVQIGHCAECEIRACAVAGKKLSSCAGCADYGCKKVADFWKSCPEAKQNLDAARA
jgi:hypothetical protein